QYDAESGMRFGSLGMMRAACEALVKFHRRLEEQEQSSSEQDQVPSGETFAEYREQWVSEGDQPGNTGEQREPHEHSQGEANNPRFIPLVLRQLVREYRDKDQVVYAEDNLEDNQGQQAEQDGRVEKLFDHAGQDVGAMAEYATSREQPLNSPSSCRSRGRTPAPAAEDAAAGAPQVTPSRSVRGPSPAAAKTRSRARYRGRVP